MKKNPNKLAKRYIIITIGSIVLGLLMLLTGLLTYVLVYHSKIYPNVSVAGISLSGLSVDEATSLLAKNVSVPKKFILTYQDQTFNIESKDINFTYDFSTSANNAYTFTRTSNPYANLSSRIGLLFKARELNLVPFFDSGELEKIVSIIAGQISIEPVDPSISKVNGEIVVDKGLPGKEVNTQKLQEVIVQNLAQNINQAEIPIEDVDPSLNDSQAKTFAKRGEKFLNKNLIMKFEYQEITLKDTDIFGLLDPSGSYKPSGLSLEADKVAEKVERDPQNPKFVFENGKVTQFQPALDGIKIDKQELINLLTQKLEELSSSEEKSLDFEIPVVKTLPEITTDKVNNLGIKELIGRGTSTYFHSISSRIHNVSLAASRINGTLVAPGKTFSFNSTLGDVSQFTGYQQAYIISGGKTILGDGGGVCQVSTTLFRAVLDAGLPIVERQAHAYRVSYYEQDSPPGLDATVYSPSPDLKFTNNTDSYILIEATADTSNYSLVFELYGTSDGRVSSISKPVVTNVSSPPEDLYQDDPSLPTGVVKQIDWKAWGARVTFNYSVERDGKTIYEKTFVSNYKPWQAVYLRGTGPAN